MSGWEQRNADFCKAQTDAGFAYIEAERRVKALEAENAKLQNTIDELRELCAVVIDDWMSKVCPMSWFCSCNGKYESCTDEKCGNQIYREEARKLGVEL